VYNRYNKLELEPLDKDKLQVKEPLDKDKPLAKEF